jgi:peptidoglycan/LPS O-acetylase OafA/YrhL
LCCIGTALLVGFLSIKYVGPNLFNDAKNNAVPALLSYANFAFFFSKNHGGLFIGGFWSLSLEEQFYLIIPVALWWFRRRLPAFMILLFVLAFFQFVQHREPWKNLAWSVRTDGLMYGVIIAIIEYRYPAFFQNAGRRIASFRPVVTLLLLPALFILLGVIGAGYFRPYTQLPISWAGVIGACLVFIATLNQGLVFNRTLVSSVLVWIGSRSYGFYLFHNIVFVLFRVINLSAFHITFYVLSFNYYLLLLATLGCLCTLCELNYRLVEMPLRNLGRRIAAQHFSGAKAEVSLV